MNWQKFIGIFTKRTFQQNELQLILKNKALSDFVSGSIGLHMIESFDFDAESKSIALENLSRLNNLIETDKALFLIGFPQSVDDLFKTEGHNKDNIPPVRSTEMSSTFL